MGLCCSDGVKDHFDCVPLVGWNTAGESSRSMRMDLRLKGQKQAVGSIGPRMIVGDE